MPGLDRWTRTCLTCCSSTIWATPCLEKEVGITGLCSDNFIVSDGSYFKPAGLSQPQAWTLRDLGVSAGPAWADGAEGRALASRIGALFSHERILKGLYAMLLEPVAPALEEDRAIARAHRQR